DVTALKNEFLRLRQLSSGFLGYHDEEAGTRAQVEFKDNPKLEMCLEILKSVVDKYKALVYHDFNFSGAIIARELNKLKIGNTRIFGGTKDTGVELAKFNEDDDC